jgi:hypothetical protein
VLGIPYYHEGGGAVFKIHMYSYLLLFSVIYVLAKLGYKRTYELLSNADTGVTYYILAVLYVAVGGVVSNGFGGMAFVIDTLLSPALALFLILNIDVINRNRIIKLLLICLIVNSLIAIAEFIVQRNFIPRLAPVWEFRSWALLSHPLNNSLITGGLMFLLVYPLSFAKKYSLILLFFSALLAFGGRVGVVFVALILFLFFLIDLRKFIFLSASFNARNVVSFHFLIIILIFFVGIAFYVGLGERVFTGFEFDGSARTRVDVFYLFDFISLTELLWGVNDKFSFLIEDVVGVSTIENVWLGWIFQFGIVATLPLTLTLINMLFRLGKNIGFLRIIVVLFLIVCSANNSLATKTPALMLFVIALVCCRSYFEIKESVKNESLAVSS